MKYFIFLFGVALLWSGAFSDSCITPLERAGECVSLSDCPQLLTAFEQRSLKNNVVTFLRQSQCGFEGYVPRVCCGPLPDQPSQPAPSTPRPPSPITGNSIDNNKDPVVQEDSYPTPRDKCGIDTNGYRMYGQQFTELDEFGWMALLGYNSSTSSKLTYQCGGALINRRYVLTAAHCVVGEIETAVGKLATARLGEYDLQANADCLYNICADPVQEYAVQAAYSNPGFSGRNINKKDDIALLRLSKRVTFSDYVQPICLVDKDLRLDVGNNVYVAGWGTTDGNNSLEKLKLGLPILIKSQCIQKYRPLKIRLTEEQLCAGGVASAYLCRGVSGGPLMRMVNSGIWEIVAVASFGHGCERDGWPGVYTSVASYLDWIQETMLSTNI